MIKMQKEPWTSFKEDCLEDYGKQSFDKMTPLAPSTNGSKWHKRTTKYMIIRSRPSALGYKTMNGTQQKAVWRQAFNLPPKKAYQQHHRHKDPNAMDVDTIEVNQASTSTNPRIQKARAEGRCYFCNQQGHMKRNCPKLPPQQSQNPEEKEETKTSTIKPLENTSGC